MTFSSNSAVPSPAAPTSLNFRRSGSTRSGSNLYFFSISMAIPCSRLPNPFQHLRDGGALAVHEHADAVDAPGEPEHPGHGREAQRQRECDLPGGRLLRDDADEHRNRREEGHERDPDRERRVGAADDREREIEADDEQQD